MQGAFDLKVDEYKQVKGLARENLRDHMTDIADFDHAWRGNHHQAAS
jgi:hypothetical protein